MLVRETTIHTAVSIEGVFIPLVTHSYWFTSSSDSSDQQLSKISTSIDHCHFVWP